MAGEVLPQPPLWRNLRGSQCGIFGSPAPPELTPLSSPPMSQKFQLRAVLGEEAESVRFWRARLPGHVAVAPYVPLVTFEVRPPFPRILLENSS